MLVPRVIEVLRRSKEVAADHALVAGLAHVAPSLQEEILATLLERGREAALAGIPEVFDRLDPPAQRLVVASASQLFPALRATVRSSDSRTRLNTIEIVRRCGNPRIAYLASTAIHDGSAQIRARAAETLREMTRAHMAADGATAASLTEACEPAAPSASAVMQTLKLRREERQFLVEALRDAVHNYESHHRPEVLEAAMWLVGELEGDLFQEDSLKRGKLTYAMLEVFGVAPAPTLAPFAYVALCHPELRRKIAGAMASLRSAEFFAEFIRCHWMARDPVIRRSLHAIRSLSWLGEAFDNVFSLPADVVEMAPRWLVLLGLPSDQKVRMLRTFLVLDHPAAARAAVWALTQIDTPASTLALEAVLDHEHAALRRVARLETAHRQRVAVRATARQAPNRPLEWTELLSQSGLPENADEFWLHFDRLASAAARRAGRHALKFVSGLDTLLRAKLEAPHSTDRLRAVRFIAALELCPAFPRELYRAANDPSPDVRAAVLAALAVLGDATSRRILGRGLHDAYPAVQVAALEGLDQLGAIRDPALLIPKAESEHPDVRAAAVRILLRMQEARGAVALVAMLRDQRVDHRCAALWVVEQLRLTAIAPRVHELIEHDPDPRIAQVARHVLRQIERPQGVPTRQLPNRAVLKGA